MEHEPRPSDFEPEKEPSIARIEALPGELGFVETEELSQLRAGVVEALAANDDEASRFARHYHLLAEAVVEQHQGSDYVKAQIGLIVQMGLIQRDAGRIDKYLENLDDALDYAWNGQLDEVVTILEAALDAAESTPET